MFMYYEFYIYRKTNFYTLKKVNIKTKYIYR